MLSIITINYNNRSGLTRTIVSILAQSYRQIEVVVIDGASTDGSVEYLTSIDGGSVRWFSEKDEGIYHAMQKGLAHVRGDAVLFLNAGDWFSDNAIVGRIADSIDIGKIVVLGRVAQVIGDDLFVRPRLEHLGTLFKHPAHQAIIVPVEIARKFDFDRKLSISADIEWARQCIVSCDCILVPWVISYVSLGGVSNSATFADLRTWVMEASGAKRWVRLTKATIKYVMRLFLGRKWLYRILAWRSAEFTRVRIK